MCNEDNLSLGSTLRFCFPAISNFPNIFVAVKEIMPMSIPPDLKKISAFIRRAEELDSDKSRPESRVVAYYCRQYAVQTGITLTGSSPEAKACLGDILNQLEGEKKAMSVFSKNESKLICRRFADSVFEKAISEDRAGAADKNTAKTFYAAASFYEILGQFYDKVEEGEEKPLEQEEEDEKRKFGKWKATEILKAIREGRKPTPGGFGDDDANDARMDGDVAADPDPAPAAAETDAFGFSSMNGAMPLPPPMPPSDPADDIFIPPPPRTPGHNDFPVAETNNEDIPTSMEEVNSPDEQGTEVGLGLPPAYPGAFNDETDQPDEHFVPSTPTSPSNAPKPRSFSKPKSSPRKASGLFGFGKKTNSSSNPSKTDISDAKELAQFALAALESKNVDLAAQRLTEALKVLGR